jgi:hypothetical protein
MGQPTHVMPNHIQHKPEKAGKTRQNQKAEMPQHNEPIQRPPSAHNQKSSSNEQQQRPQTYWEVGVQFQATPFLSEDGLYDLFPPSSWQRQPSVAGGDTSVKSVV